MSTPEITITRPLSARVPKFIRNSLRARIVLGISIMLLPLLGLATAALLGINSVNASFKAVMEKVIEEMEPTMRAQIAIVRAAMPPNDYLIHGQSAERDKFARLSEKVERAFKRLLEPGRFHREQERALIGSAHEEWRRAQSISATLLALPRPVGDAAAASEMKRLDAHVDHAADLLARLDEFADAEIERDFAKGTATGHTMLQIVFGVFGVGFALAMLVGAALARSILARVKALSEGARAFGEENFSYRVQLEGHDELGRLASVFNTMAAELDKNHRALKEASIRDPLTGLCNRREFDRRLRDELLRCERYRHPLSLLMLDLDHFKAINDSHGHPVGDKVLREVADIVKHALRASDEVARDGGEEFAVILPETANSGAQVLAERIRVAVADHTLAIDDQRRINVTLSIGLANFPGDAGTDARLIVAADSALYAAKRAGRNRVCSFAGEQADDFALPKEGGP